MTRLPSIHPRSKSSALLKDIQFHKTKSPPRVTFPRNFKRLWGYLRAARAPLKPSTFYYDFFNLIPHPFYLSGNYFRLQTRTFIYWYEFSARQFNISFDFGVKQKKILMEDAIWRRPTRRAQSQLTGWWSYVVRFSTYYHQIQTSSFFRLNRNFKHPVFSESPVQGFSWFEETLPLIRQFAWSYYSRLMPYVSNFAPLSQSLFYEKLLYRRAPLDATTLWLASPVHDYSAFVKSYTNNRSFILPERFFQFRRYRHQLTNVWSQATGRFWRCVEKVTSFGAVPFVFGNQLTFYAKLRILVSVFPFFKSVNQFRPLFTSVVSRLPFVWSSRVLPVVTRARRSKRFAFFLRRFFFLRHLRNRLPRDPKILSFSFKYASAIKQLHRFFTQWFQLYAFNGSLSPHSFLWFLVAFFQQRRSAARHKPLLAVAQLNADYVRRPRKLPKKKSRHRR